MLDQNKNENLLLYSAAGELRVNQAEAERRNAEAERGRAERAELRAELTQRKAEEESRRAEQARQALAAENARLLEKLRQLEQKG